MKTKENLDFLVRVLTTIGWIILIIIMLKDIIVMPNHCRYDYSVMPRGNDAYDRPLADQGVKKYTGKIEGPAIFQYDSQKAVVLFPGEFRTIPDDWEILLWKFKGNTCGKELAWRAHFYQEIEFHTP